MDIKKYPQSRWLAAALAVIGLGLLIILLMPRAAVYQADTVLEGSHVIPEGKRLVLKDGAKLHVTGDLSLEGSLTCAGGPLQLRVDGALRVSGELRCDRPEELPDGDIGSGIALAVGGGVEFTGESIVVSNGHVQLVDDAAKLAVTEADIDLIYADAADDSGDGVRVGPLVPIDGEEAGGTGLLLPDGQPGPSAPHRRGALSRFLIPEVRAAAIEPASDLGGMPVPDTVKIGGNWVMGHGQAPPPGIVVPTPPKKVGKVILYYNFSFGKTVVLNDLFIFGPAGREGESDVGASCDAKGRDGEDAFRFNALVKDIVINDFTIFLGDGGRGGEAASKEGCEHGQAVGGSGGQPGNMKMISTGTFKIVGAMKVVPGTGGSGGDARAFGKKGEDGCPAGAGGEATSRGGKGGDNKKGLKVVSVAGVENIELDDLLGGAGGHATSFGGDGGDGDGPGCAGGAGGKATAYGGAGGDTASRTVKSFGGPGGDADPYPGVGGDGGKGDTKAAGGKGGKGGDGAGAPGKGGSGRTESGPDGIWSNEDGAPGGDGGDGCGPGAGGKGGSHINPGVDGRDGADLCPGEQKKAAFRLGTDVLRKRHVIGRSPCPDPFGESVTIEGPEGGRWEIDKETVPPSLGTGSLGGSIGSGDSFFDVFFTCNINDFSSHTEEGRVKVRGFGPDGAPLGESFFDVFIDVAAP